MENRFRVARDSRFGGCGDVAQVLTKQCAATPRTNRGTAAEKRIEDEKERERLLEEELVQYRQTEALRMAADEQEHLAAEEEKKEEM